MRAVVFLGPSLSRTDAHAVLDAEYRPPVEMGDILRVLEEGPPDVIAIVDGRFDSVPSVWHKEILLAMEEGVVVAGAASMGALRAAELHSFGMVGLGRIFELFRDGALEDDDEVAMAHGDAAAGFAPMSDAMVDIRDDCEQAAARGLVPKEVADQFIAIGRELFYARRTWSGLLRRAPGFGIPTSAAATMRSFVANRGQGRKQRDTVALLKWLATAELPRTPGVSVERTVYLERLRHDVRLAIAAGRRTAPRPTTVLPSGTTLAHAEERALLRVLSRRVPGFPQVQASRRDLAATRQAFRERRRLSSDQELVAWLRERGIDRRACEAFIEDATRIRLLAARLDLEIRALLPDEVRLAPEEKSMRRMWELSEAEAFDALESGGLVASSTMRPTPLTPPTRVYTGDASMNPKQEPLGTGFPFREDLPELAPDFELKPDIFPFVSSPPDALIVQVQRPRTGEADPIIPDGCLADAEAKFLADSIANQLRGQDIGLPDADVRHTCSRLQTPQTVPGEVDKVLRFATTIGAWRDQTVLPGENAARDRALVSIDLIRGIETFHTLVASHARASFVKQQAAARIAKSPRVDREGEADPAGPIVLTGVEVVFDQPPDAVATAVRGFYDGRVLDVDLTIGLVERLFVGDESGTPLCETERTVRIDDPRKARLLRLLGVTLEPKKPPRPGPLCELTDEFFGTDSLEGRLAYLDFSVDELGVTARAAAGGIAANGPGQLTLDVRAPGAISYSADIPQNQPEPTAFEWSVDRGEAQPNDAQTTEVSFDLHGESGPTLRHVTLTVTNDAGVRHTVTRGIRINAVFVERPFGV